MLAFRVHRPGTAYRAGPGRATDDRRRHPPKHRAQV